MFQMRRNLELEATIVDKYAAVETFLDARGRRIWSATVSRAIGYGGNTRTDAGLRVKAKLDKRKYPTGERVTKAQMGALSLHRNEFRGDWNYELRPR